MLAGMATLPPDGKGEGSMTQERIRELTKGMLRKKFYVILSKGGAAPEQLAEHCRAISNT